jgi:CRISPR-associated protein Cmr1
MNQLDFDCEVLTPLFLGGAEPRVRPELRPPSIRGALRYWYRAILGGSNLIASGSDEDQLKALKEHETSLFGSTDRGSAVALIVHTKTQSEIEAFHKDRAIRTADGSYLPSGKDYLLWSMAASGRPDTPRYQPDREFIKPGTKFEIRLQTWRNDDALKKSTAALWLLANLGAVGARANRGAGSLEVRSGATEATLPTFKACRTIDELQSYLSEGVRRCRTAIVGDDAGWRRLDGKLAGYDTLSPESAEIWIVSNAANGWATHLEVLNGIGEKLRDYRSHRNPLGRADHDAVLEWMEKGGSGPQIKRAVFGLPIPFRYSEGGPGDVVQSTTDSDRRASPLRIRITRLGTGRYVGVLTLFKSRFLEEGTKLQLQTRKWKAPPPTDYKVIQDFIQTFESKREVAP